MTSDDGPFFKVSREVYQDANNTRAFKNLANTVLGTGLQIPEDNILFFGYRVSHQGQIKVLVAAGTCRPAKRSGQSEPAESQLIRDELFLTDDCHIIEYLLVDKYYQRNGYGGQLLAAMERYCQEKNNRAPIRLHAASKARGFFLRHHYKQLTQEPIQTETRVHKFAQLFPMERKAGAPRSITAQGGRRRCNGRRYRDPDAIPPYANSSRTPRSV